MRSVQILVLLRLSCVTPRKSLNFSVQSSQGWISWKQTLVARGAQNLSLLSPCLPVLPNRLPSCLSTPPSCSQALLHDEVSSWGEKSRNCLFIHLRFPPSFLCLSPCFPLRIYDFCHLEFFLISPLYSWDGADRQTQPPRTQGRAHSAFQKTACRNRLTITATRILRIYIKFNGGFFFFFQHNKLREKHFFPLK